MLSYNIRVGGGERLDDIAAVIRAAGPDAVALLEATSRANAEQPARMLGMELVFARRTSASTSPG
jgi:endonuclease/exonuclease/phosphatase family metal-dependent hydrolase